MARVASSMRVDWRIVACVGLASVLALAGCLGATEAPTDAPRLAQPTDRAPEVPSFRNVTPINRTPDFNDPGYLMEVEWHVGDEWHYLSNKSNYRKVKVLRHENVGGRDFLVVFEEGNRVGSDPNWGAFSYVDARTLVRSNFSYVTGDLAWSWSPGNPQEQYRKNGTFAYNETELRHGLETLKYGVRANSYFAGYETVPLYWGKVPAGRVEHRILKTDADGNTVRELFVRHPVREYGIDAQYQLPSGELWRLWYVKYGGTVVNEPVAWVRTN